MKENKPLKKLVCGFPYQIAYNMSTLQVLSQAIRPLVWEKGLWSGELEKAWTHLFDIVACLMKLGYPHEYQVQQNAI